MSTYDAKCSVLPDCVQRIASCVRLLCQVPAAPLLPPLPLPVCSCTRSDLRLFAELLHSHSDIESDSDVEPESPEAYEEDEGKLGARLRLRREPDMHKATAATQQRAHRT